MNKVAEFAACPSNASPMTRPTMVNGSEPANRTSANSLHSATLNPGGWMAAAATATATDARDCEDGALH